MISHIDITSREGKIQLLIFGVLAGCLFSFAGSEDLRALTVIQTSDIHCCISDDNDSPGWLTLAGLIRQEIKKNGGPEKCLLIDCGDTFQGSYVGAFSKGGAAVLMLNSLKYDCWIPGNHDYDFGVARFFELISGLKPEIIAANMPSLPGFEDSKIRKWRILTKNGIRIALIGLTLPSSPEIPFDLKYPDMISAIDAIIPDIMDAKPDIIILGIHQGLNRPAGAMDKSGILEIARRYPQIKIILGGHTHTANPGEKIGWSSWFAQAAPYARSAVKLAVSLDRYTGRIDSLSSELIIPSPGDACDEESSAVLKDLLEGSRKESSEIVATIESPLIPYDGNESMTCALNEAFCRTAIEATGSDAAFFGAANSFSLPAGKITRAEIFNLIPYENKIWTIQLSPCEIREVFHEQMGLEDKERMLSAYGIRLQPRSGGSDNEKVFDTEGRYIPEDSRISVCFGSYSASGAGGRFPCLRNIFRIQENKPQDTGILVRDALQNYLGRLKKSGRGL